ncbi:MAG: TetR/AcrR family transcriptional regulator [Gemmobacter sp.]
MSTDRPRRAETAQDTAARLIAAGRRAFAEAGFAAVSLDALAAEAGVTRGALHHRFGNKAGLFEAVLREVDAELLEEVAQEWDGAKDRWMGFRACYHAYLEAALRPDRRRILFQDAAAVLGTRAIDILMDSGFGEVVEELGALMVEGKVRPLAPEAVAHALNGGVLNLAFWAADAPDVRDRLPAAHATLAAMFDGLEMPRG